MGIKYSICSTTYNIASKVSQSLDSLLKFTDDSFEFVIVDSESSDGTYEILKNYKKTHEHIKVITKKCKRGLGRQIAYENSEGEYIIAVDLDTVYYPIWISFIRKYERLEKHMNFALHAPYLGIYPRHLIEEVGGWRNLQWGEDFDLWYRLMLINAFKWTPIVMGQNWITEEKEMRQTRNIMRIIWRKFIAEKDRFIARSEYSLGDRIQEIKNWSNPHSFYLFWIPLTFSAYLASLPYREKRDPLKVCQMWYRNLIIIDLDGEKLFDLISFPKRIENFCKGRMIDNVGGNSHL